MLISGRSRTYSCKIVRASNSRGKSIQNVDSFCSYYRKGFVIIILITLSEYCFIITFAIMLHSYSNSNCLRTIKDKRLVFQLRILRRILSTKFTINVFHNFLQTNLYNKLNQSIRFVNICIPLYSIIETTNRWKRIVS